MIKKIIPAFFIAIITAAFLIAPAKVFAVNDTFYSGNDILFFDPDAKACGAGASTGSTGSVKLDANDATLKQIFTLLISSGQFNAVQAAAIMGNMYTESKFNSAAVEGGNGIGYGLAQWSFGRRTNLENFAKQKGVAASDIPMQIEFLTNEYTGSYKSRLATTAFGTGTDVSASTGEWMNKFEVPANNPPSADYPKLQSERIPAAVQIYGFFKDLAPAATASTAGSQNCSTSNAIVAGNIVQTAINLAQPQPLTTGKTAKSDARDTYQKVKEEFNPSVQWSDCGGYVATVMISSGVDKDYVKVGVTKQVEYVKSKPDKYKIIENPTTADLQPGDILLSSKVGHTTLYLGENSTGFPAVDASLGQRVPSLQKISNSIWMIDSGSIIARYIGTAPAQ